MRTRIRRCICSIVFVCGIAMTTQTVFAESTIQCAETQIQQSDNESTKEKVSKLIFKNMKLGMSKEEIINVATTYNVEYISVYGKNEDVLVLKDIEYLNLQVDAYYYLDENKRLDNILYTFYEYNIETYYLTVNSMAELLGSPETIEEDDVRNAIWTYDDAKIILAQGLGADNTECMSLTIEYNTDQTEIDKEYGVVLYEKNFSLVTTSGAVLREKPTQDGEIINTIASNTTVTVMGYTAKWYKVRYDSMIGYVNKNLFKEFNDNPKSDTSNNHKKYNQNKQNNNSDKHRYNPDDKYSAMQDTDGDGYITEDEYFEGINQAIDDILNGTYDYSN